MHGLKAKTLKRMLKKAGLKASGKKSTLKARAKKAHLIRGGVLVAAGELQSPAAGPGSLTGGGLKAKTLKRMLKKAGLKTSGKKSTLKARAKKAHLVRGGMGLTEEGKEVLEK
jgi:uncharacterized protein YneF (UPF0154 family)